MTQKPPPIAVGPNEGKTVSVAGGTYRVLITGEQTDGAFATIDMLVPPGGGPGPHAHADFQETFYVISGTVEITSETGTYTAGPGSYAVIPKGGVVHQFKNKMQEPAHLLCTVVPAGLENLFLEIGRPVEWGSFLPPVPPDAAGLEKLKAVLEKYGQSMYPPNFFEK